MARCLQSVIHQTFSDWEAIVINNYSPDNTIEVVNSFTDPRIQLINFRNNGIIGASRNVGIWAAKADWIAFLDSDDWWYPQKLEMALGYLKCADIIFHNLHIFTPKGKKLRIIKGRRLKKPVFVDLMTGANPIATSSVIVKKNILNSRNLFSEERDLVSVEDFDLWLRLSLETEKFSHINKTLGAYWHGSDNMSAAANDQYDRISSVYKKYLPLLSSQDRFQAETTMCYLLGHIQRQRGLKQDASNLYKISLRSNILKIKIKSFLRLAFLAASHNRKFFSKNQ